MSAHIYYERDASLAPLEGKKIAFIGYGNQGRAQCLNLRDTISKANLTNPPTIQASSLEDSYFATAKADKVPITSDFVACAKDADIIFLLFPDEFQPSLFNNTLAPVIKQGACVVVASGYNYFFNKLHVHESCDVVMVAPRMIGTSVRTLFEKGSGFPCFVNSERNATGKADEICLSIALAIGALRTGAIKSSCREEALIDLFAEQALFPAVITIFQEAYKTLKGLGASDEALCYELFMSKEPAEIFEKMADDGFIKQLVHHSTVSQYGQLKGSLEYPKNLVEDLRKEYKRVADQRILNGEFEKEFSAMEETGGGVKATLDKLYKEAEKSELAVGEKKVRERLGQPC